MGTAQSIVPCGPCTSLSVADQKQTMQASVDSDASKPPFEFIKTLLPDAQRRQVLKGLELSHDPSSEFFTERSKAIRYVEVDEGRLRTFPQNYFIQNSEYNDFSGGVKRYFKLLPDELFRGALADVILKFTHYYDIPENTTLLVQMQTSTLSPSSRRQSLTGQGIHTDGHDRAMLMCMHRGSQCRGALNQFHKELDGSQPLCTPALLEPGDAVMFKDNELYHYVTPGWAMTALDDEETDTRRTMLLIHSPVDFEGEVNKTNSLKSTATGVKLRRDSEMMDTMSRMSRCSTMSANSETREIDSPKSSSSSSFSAVDGDHS